MYEPTSVPWLPAAVAVSYKRGMDSLLSQSRHWRRLPSPKIPSKLTTQQTAANKFVQWPFSPDLACSNFHFSGSMRKYFKGTHFRHDYKMTAKVQWPNNSSLQESNMVYCWDSVSLWQIRGAINIVFNSWFTVLFLLGMELSIPWPSSPQPIQEAPYRHVCSVINTSVISVGCYLANILCIITMKDKKNIM